MKKLLSTVVFSAMACISLNADYKLVLTDVDGNQTQECIKSYSFSNNLESLAKQNGVGKDIYSEEETMTNKVYMGKPLYRKLVKIPTLINDNVWRYGNYVNPPQNVDKIFNTRIIGADISAMSRWNGSDRNYQVNVSINKIGYGIGKLNSTSIGDHILLEYTKTTDTANTSSNTFKSYLHYVPSSSTTDEVITKDMKNLGVQFLEGYSYNPNTLSCDKIQ